MTKGKLQRWKKREVWNNIFLDNPHSSISLKSNYVHMISQEERTERLELVKTIEKDVAISVNDNESRITVLRSDVDGHGTMTIQFCGGLNGNGEWDAYFSDLAKIVETLKEKYEIWLIKLDNDCIDDKFYATFGIAIKK